MSIRFLTAGDSHGESLVGIVEGIPAGVKIAARDIEKELMRRRKSYGRSSRQMIEKDEVEVISGVWNGRSTGAPLGLLLPNRGRVVQGKGGGAMGTTPRPGHADLAGVLKYGLHEIPPVSERASARSTAMRVAVGAIAKAVLRRADIGVVGHVVAIGDVLAPRRRLSADGIRRRAVRSPVFCADAAASKRMVDEIQRGKAEGNSLGGSVEVIVTGAPPGLGSHVMWDRKLDARLAGAMMSIQSVKAVDIGDGIASARKRGVDAHDAMTVKDGALVRASNHAGGIEGGMTNGEDVVVRLHAKPIPTAQRRAKTFDLRTLEDTDSPYVRSDVCVIPALSVIAEAVAAWEILAAFVDKFGGDTIDEALAARDRYLHSIRKRLGG
jgi:chorismate synthase